MKKRAALYTRVSTADQSDKGYSLPSQLDLCRKYAERLGYTVTAELQEDHSGATPIGERPEGKKLAEMLKARQADAVVVYQVDRLSRDIVNLLATVQMWIRSGIEVHLCDVGKIESELDIVLVIKGWQGSDERQKIRERSMRGKRAKAQSGKVVGCRAPYGYQHVRDANGKVVTLAINDETARIVGLIFGWYTRGDADGKPLSTDAIAKRLHDMGIPTPGELQRGYNRTRGPAVWGKGTILDILDNQVYAGIWRFGVLIASTRTKRPLEEQILVNVPAIIDRAAWDRAQARRKYNKAMAARNAKRGYLLHGLIACECNSNLSGNFKCHQRYYFCNESRTRGVESKCRAHTVRADAIEADVWSEIEELFSDLDRLWCDLEAAQQEELDLQEPTRSELEAIEASIQQTERKASGLARTLVSLLDTDPDGVVTKSMQVDVDQTNALHREQVKRCAELQAKLSTRRLADEAIAEIMHYARDVQQGIQNADDDAKRRMLEALGVKVKVKDGHYKITCVLGETEGKVRKIPRFDSRAVVTASHSCNGPNDTAPRIPDPRRRARAASSVPNSGHSALRS